MTSSTSLVSPLGQLQAVCENATVALFVMDEHQRCTYMNASAEVLTGFSLAEVQGRTLHGLIHHTRPDGTPYPLDECPIDRAAPQNMQERGEEVFVHRDGRFYPVAFTASPIRRDGVVVGTVLEVRDISRERQRGHEDVAFRQLSELMLQELELAPMVQAVTDTATQLAGAQFGAFFYNVDDGGGGSLMLYTLSGLPASRFSAFGHPRATPLFGPTFRGEGTVCIEDVLVDPRYGHVGPHHGMPPGHPPVRSFLAVPVKSDSGEVLGGLFFGHDRPGVFSAEHARMVESIAALASVGMSRLRLFRALQTEAQEKEHLYQEAVRASRTKDQFLAMISHELRTPLTSILGWSEMLASGRLAPDMTQRAVATIDRNARAQAQIIDDLLDISRIISGKLRLAVRDIDPAQPVEAAIDAVRPAALARDVELSVSVAPQLGRLAADPDRLQQVVWNLVTNAVKFTDRGGRVDVEVSRGRENVEIRVRDSGRGIAPDFLPHVFERFSQVDASSTREHGGLGLGLSIVRHLVEMHGGSVQAWSEGLGSGSQFTVRLPFSTTAATPADDRRAHERAAVAPAAPTADALAGCHIALVEDDADSRAMLAAVLEAHGARVTACASAVAALEVMNASGPGLVISDIGMPGMDGYAFIRALREAEQAAGRDAVPAVALTAYARAEDRMQALAHGFQMHVAKPVQPSELVAVAQSLCGWRSAPPSP
ncbi:hybrid sensor histidine kinase/response regulator [Cognatilysobacter lacus]|uniref:histidine kinase n=1 Tax=Cognatilysobacter lacus TaxID=1643323 RepID=A0A5D8Z984_9GAMM|nr:ATP-binding protein [Lysobacter lacus]TZF91495.1 response regulator [Lysobacter lacus]